jgi:hypothetical protein
MKSGNRFSELNMRKIKETSVSLIQAYRYAL